MEHSPPRAGEGTPEETGMENAIGHWGTCMLPSSTSKCVGLCSGLPDAFFFFCILESLYISVERWKSFIFFFLVSSYNLAK